jgi:hypothetical protein
MCGIVGIRSTEERSQDRRTRRGRAATKAVSHHRDTEFTEFFPPRPPRLVVKYPNSWLHHRGTEFTEFGVCFDRDLFPPRPPRLVVKYPDSCFTAEAQSSQRINSIGRSAPSKGRRGRENSETLAYFALFVVNQNARHSEAALAGSPARKPEAPKICRRGKL